MKIALALVTALTTLSGCGASPSPNPQIKPADSRAEIRPGDDRPGWVRCPYCVVRVCTFEDKILDPMAEVTSVAVEVDQTALPGGEVTRADLLVTAVGDPNADSVELDHMGLTQGPITVDPNKTPDLNLQGWSEATTVVVLDVKDEKGDSTSMQMPMEVKVEACGD